MDVKWLFIGFFSLLALFRATHPTVFSRWIRLQWEELEEGRGNFGASILSMVIPAGLFFILSEALELDLLWWQAPMIISGLLAARLVVSIALNLLFSNSTRISFAYDLFGGLQLSTLYAASTLFILTGLLFDKDLASTGIYVLGTAHVFGMIWHLRRNAVLQNIKNTGSRFYAMSYLCTLELVLIFSFVI